MAMNDSEPTIATVTPEQIPAIVSLAERSNLSHWPSSAYEGAIGRPDAIFLALTGHGIQLLGFIVGSVVPGAAEDTLDAEIYNIAVEEAFSRQGCGRILLQTFAAECKMRNVAVIWLEVRSSNDGAIRFYESNRFAPVGVRKNFYTDPVDDGLIMRAEAGGF